MHCGRLIARRRLFGPGEHALESAFLEAQLLLTQHFREAGQARLEHGLSRAEGADQWKGASANPEVVEASRVAG